MTKLEQHFQRMQDMAARYILPQDQPYVDREGNTSKVASGSDQSVRDRLFANDMLYMLDGPEQRAAQVQVDGPR
jgi:hypothetical protein